MHGSDIRGKSSKLVAHHVPSPHLLEARQHPRRDRMGRPVEIAGQTEVSETAGHRGLYCRVGQRLCQCTCLERLPSLDLKLTFYDHGNHGNLSDLDVHGNLDRVIPLQLSRLLGLTQV